MADVKLSDSSWLHLSRLLEFKGKLFWDQTEYPDIPFDTDDEYLELTDLQAKRIDLLAFEKYGDSELMWVLMLANDKNLPNQFIGGETIRIPAKTTIDSILDQADNQT